MFVFILFMKIDYKGIHKPGKLKRLNFSKIGKNNQANTEGKKINSDTGNRTRACWVRASYPNP